MGEESLSEAQDVCGSRREKAGRGVGSRSWRVLQTPLNSKDHRQSQKLYFQGRVVIRLRKKQT